MRNSKNLLSILFLLLPFFGFAQKSYLAATVGGSFPMGKYSESVLDYATNSVPGAAKIGFQGTVDFAKYFNDYLGLSATLGYSQHGYSTTALDNEFNSGSQFGDPHVDITAKSYHNLFFFAGPSVGYQVDKVFFDLRMMAGVYSSSFPELSINAHDSIRSESEKLTASRSTQLGFLFGPSMRYQMNDKLSFLFKVDFILSSLSYNVSVDARMTEKDPYTGETSTDTHNTKFVSECKVSTFVPSIGIAFNLD